MCIYLIVDFVLLFLFWSKNKENSKLIFILSCFALFFLMSAHNGNFNPILDYTNYMNLFLGKYSIYGDLDVKGGYELEYPFYYFDIILRHISKTPLVYILGTSITFCAPFFYLIKKESLNPALSILLLMLVNGTQIYLFFFSAHRQMFETMFLLWAYIVYRYTNIKYKQILVFALLFLGLSSHSSSFFIIPIAIFLFFIKTPSKKKLYLIICIALILGLFLRTFVSDNVTYILSMFGGIDELERSTHYMLDNVYGDQKTYEFTSLPPHALLICLFVYLYSNEELQTYPVKCWITGFVLFLGLSSVQLINRALLFFFLMGFAGALPNALKRIKVKKMFFMVLIFFIYIAYRRYTDPEYLLLPYNFYFF